MKKIGGAILDEYRAPLGSYGYAREVTIGNSSLDG